MKKQLFLTAVGSLLLIAGASAQTVVITNSFEEWQNGKPVGWNGNQTHSTGLTITQVTTGAVYGSSAAGLQADASTGHRRFASAPVSVEDGKEYVFKYYVKGNGRIRAGLFDNDGGGGVTAFRYSAYADINSADWVEIEQTVEALNTYNQAQFLFSLAENGSVQIDSVSITEQDAPEVPFTPVYDIQYTTDGGGASPLAGTTIFTGGIVTGIEPGVGFFLQSGSGPWSGIFVYQPSTTVVMGDSITLSATVEERFNNTELGSVNGLSKVSSGNALPAPVVAPTGTLSSEAYEGVLVRAENAPATNLPDVHGKWPINDGSGQIWVDTLIYRYSQVTLLPTRYNVQGVIKYTFNSFRILPRSASDVEQVTGMNKQESISGLTVFPNPAAGPFRLSLHAETGGQGMIRIMDVTGKQVYEQVVTLAAGSNEVSITDLAAPGGIYQLQLMVGEQTVTRRLVVE